MAPILSQILGLFVIGIVRGLIAPYAATRDVYALFASGARIMWLDIIYVGATMYGFGYVAFEFSRNWEIFDILWPLIGYGLILAAIATISEKIKAIEPGSAFAFLGWVPRLAFLDGGFSTFAGPSNQGQGSDRGKRVVRGSIIGNGAEEGPRLKAEAARNNVDLSLNIELGGVPIDYRTEAQHFFIGGTTGAGKSQAIRAMLRTVRERKQPAIVADPAGGYLACFGRQTDIVLNPFDARDMAWSPFLELEHDYDCPRIAKAAIPDADGPSQEWNFYAQTLFGEILKVQWRNGNHSVKELLRLVMSADVKELAELLKGTPAATLTAKGNEKMLSNTRAIASTYLGVWDYLEDRGSFSVRQWVRQVGAGENDSWLFLAYRDDQMALLRNLIATWLELAIVEGLSLTENPDRRLWYVMDELDSLGKVTSLRAGLTKLRKYGGVCVNGLQTIAQLRSTYGKDEAQTLLSCMATKLILKAGDSETAEYFSREIGEREIERSKTTHGESAQNMGMGGSTSQNRTKEHTTESAVMPAEVLNLPPLEGFLKPVAMHPMRINLEYVSMPDTNAPFIKKQGR